MRRNGEIIIIEDDKDDRLLLKDIFESLGYPNKLTFIGDPMEVVSYLSNPLVMPFIIFSDINMPKINDFELREQILANLEISTKCVPYIFLSTSKNPVLITWSEKMNVGQYIKKSPDIPNVIKNAQVVKHKYNIKGLFRRSINNSIRFHALHSHKLQFYISTLSMFENQDKSMIINT